ncbi:MAG: ArsR/SmtB family transcription factor [Promethearchaeota archaeon]
MEIEKQAKKEIKLNLDTLLEILGNPTRRAILAKLAKVPHSTSELARSLKISRQATHSQLDILENYGLIEKIETEKRGSKYKIKSNINVRIDISPDYYNINYNFSFPLNNNDSRYRKKIGFPPDYNKLKKPGDKIKVLAKKIKDLETNLEKIEKERQDMVHFKQCLISELKNVIEMTYDTKYFRNDPEFDNLEKEIALSLFFNPKRYFDEINIDELLEDVFFTEMDKIRKEQSNVLIRHLLRDLSRFIDFLYEEDDSWFFRL